MSAGTPIASIPNPYLLAIEQGLPLYQDSDGQLFAEQLWQHDLAMHLQYLSTLSIACPRLYQAPPLRTSSLPAQALRVVDLPVQTSLWHTFKLLPTLVRTLHSAIRRTDVVHTAVAGWPIPMGWIAAPLALLLGKKLVIIVESAPWRLTPGIPAGYKAKLRASFQENMAQAIVRRAHLAIFTQEEYRSSLMGADSPRGHVIHASWIDEQDILSLPNAQACWDCKPSLPLKLLFAGRLVAEKGVHVLLAAMSELAGKHCPVTLDILGEGPLQGVCEAAAAELAGTPTTINLLGTVAYGAPLLRLLRPYHAVVVPTLTDEQPRIIFDAYSQAVPIIASDTAGLRSCVQDANTGFLLPPGNAHALAESLATLSGHPDHLRTLGLTALEQAGFMTHQQMHRRRAVLLRQMLS